MDSEEENPRISRRVTRSLASSSVSNNAMEKQETISVDQMKLGDVGFSGDPISLDNLILTFPGRESQIIELVQLLGELNSPMLPLFVYGDISSGKTSVVLQVFQYLNRPFVYSSCLTCYSPKILFESILNQLLLHRKNATNGYSSVKRCEKPSEFVCLLREALSNVVNNLKGILEKTSSDKLAAGGRGGKGNMVYLIFDNLELVREWDNSSTILPFLFNLYELLNMPEVGLIFISNTSPDTYYSNMGYVEPIPIYFPNYKEDELRQILLRNKSNQKLYSSFLDIVLKPFCRVTLRLDELSTAFEPLFEKYLEPLSNRDAIPNEEMKRRLFSHLKLYIASSLNETFNIISIPSSEAVKEAQRERNQHTYGGYEEINKFDLHMSTCAKYLLISAYLASRNPATLDASLFDSTGGSDNRKRRRKPSSKAMEQKDNAQQELLMKGPGTFPLERLLAIYQCITSVGEDLIDEEEQRHNGMSVQGGDGGLMSDVLLQLSSLCNANFILKGGSCPLEGSTRYRSTVSEDLALKVAKSLEFPLAKYIYRN